MSRIVRHIIMLARTLLVVLLFVAAIPYRPAFACPHRDGGEAAKASCCRRSAAPAPGKDCCGHDVERSCCCVVPMVRLFLSPSGCPDVASRSLPEVWFISPLRTSPSVPSIPPPRS